MWCGVSKPMPVMMAVFTDLTDFYVVFTRQNSISTFQVPVWNLGTQLQTKGALEFLKNKCPLIFEAFSADNKFLIGNGHSDTEKKTKT